LSYALECCFSGVYKECIQLSSAVELGDVYYDWLLKL